MSKKYKVRTMTKDEISIAIEWAAKEGWNPGLYDGECFYQTDPTGFFIGLLDDEPIACISAVSYDETFGFVGFYIVKPEYRDKGYGIQIWNKAIEYLKTQNIGLDGVLDQQINYEKSGFKFVYSNIRYEGKSKNIESNNCISLLEIPFSTILEFDTNFFPTQRESFIKSWINMKNATSLCVMENQKLSGYGVIRSCKTGYKIGPLFAENEIIAEDLFNGLISKIPTNSTFYLDIPEVNREAFKLVEKYNMNSVFKTVRMYTKEFPNLPVNKIFGVTTFELG